MSRPINGDDVFRAVAHPARRRILELLRRQDFTVSELARKFRLSFPAVSQNLRMLRTANLAAQRREGRTRVYRLRRTALDRVVMWSAQFNQPAPQR